MGLCGSKQGAQVQFPGQGIRILHTVHEPGLRQQIKKNLKVSSKKLLIKRSRMTKTIFKKNKFEGLTLPNIKTYSKATVKTD